MRRRHLLKKSRGRTRDLRKAARWKGGSGIAIVGTGSSDLALDVYFAEGGRTKLLEKRCTFADLYSILLSGLLVELLFNGVLGAMRLEKITTYFDERGGNMTMVHMRVEV